MTLVEFIGIAIAILIPTLTGAFAFIKSHYNLSSQIASMEAANKVRFEHIEHDLANDKDGRKAMQQVLVELATMREQITNLQETLKRLLDNQRGLA